MKLRTITNGNSLTPSAVTLWIRKCIRENC